MERTCLDVNVLVQLMHEFYFFCIKYVFNLDRAGDHIHTVEPSMKGLQSCVSNLFNSQATS